MSKEVENHGEEDQQLRWSEFKRIWRKERKYHPFEGVE
jgi:hypothetical protein